MTPREAAPKFVFATCQAGAELALKAEVARELPMLRPAYSRPGFVTFKLVDEAGGEWFPDFDLRSVFAHSYGLSVGKVEGATQGARLAFIVAQVEALAKHGGAWRLHVYPRELGEREESEAVELAAAAVGLNAELRKACPIFEAGENDKVGDYIVDIVLVSRDEWWLGYHSHTHAHRPGSWLGGVPRFDLPKEAPSRAYLKIREALEWSGLPLRKGQLVLELGSAPGGASFWLLEQGLSVVGVDPGLMSAAVARNSRFKQLRMQAEQVTAQHVEHFDWIVSDMNIAPDEALRALEKLLALGGLVRGGVVTLKFHAWDSAADLPRWVERIRKLGFPWARAAHLFHNRMEACVVFSSEML